MWLRRKPRREAFPATVRRVAGMRTEDLSTWTGNTFVALDQALRLWRKSSEPRHLDEARLAADVLVVLLDEAISRSAA